MAAASPFIIEVNDHDFESQVLERSFQVPVVLDFWAPWCGPCRTLTPILEKLAQEANGRWILAKVNTDNNPLLSQSFGIRSIPAVKAVREGRLLDQFNGALPEPQIRQWLDAIAPAPVPDVDWLEAGQEALDAGDLLTAQTAFGRALDTLGADNPDALKGLIRVALRNGDLDDAEAMLNALTTDDADAERFELKLRRDAIDAPPKADLIAAVEANPDDLEARYNLALVQAADQDWDGAMRNLLAIVQRDREWRDDIGRTTMIEFFQVLGIQHDTSIRWRKRLGAIMYV